MRRNASDPPYIGIMSPWILWRTIHLQTFLQEEGAPLWVGKGRLGRPARLAAIAGWGYKQYSAAAQARARQWGVPYWALEDGFLRSHRLGVEGTTPLSLIVDPVGIYYDARRPSRLENLINDCAGIGAQELADARALMAYLREHNLGKYNHAPDLDAAQPIGRDRPLVLVIDQTRGDYSLSGGLADDAVLERMLDAALQENPGADVRIRTHPDVLAGKKESCLAAFGQARGIPIDASTVSMASMLKRAQRVYAATSNAGLEALIHGVPVTCFGTPFYAGWGLTDDRQRCERRVARPTLEHVVAAAYLRYCRYVDPLTGRRTDALSVARHLSLARARAALVPSGSVVGGVRRHKQASIRAALAKAGDALVFRKDIDAARTQAGALGAPWLGWAGKMPEDAAAGAARNAGCYARIEDGFLRSAGLGAKKVAAQSLVLDRTGIYFDPRTPSDLETLIEAGGFGAAELAEAAALRQAIVAARLSKYNVGRKAPFAPARAAGREKLLVVGQVEDDASMLCGSPQVRSNAALLEAVRRAHPDAWILYKPHPDVEAGKRKGRVPAQALRQADQVAADWSVAELFDVVDGVHTMTSLAGFEALLRGLPVTTHGGPFYAGWGLTHDRLAFARRTRRATLDEVVAAAYLRYALYCDPETGLPCDVWHVLARLDGTLDVSGRTGLGRRQQLRNVIRALRG